MRISVPKTRWTGRISLSSHALVIARFFGKVHLLAFFSVPDFTSRKMQIAFPIRLYAKARTCCEGMIETPDSLTLLEDLVPSHFARSQRIKWRKFR